MANPEHQRLVLTPEWNEWRGRNSGVTPDLTNADLSGKDVSGKDLRRADLSNANLSGATLAGTDFTLLNDWAGAQPSLDDVFNGAPYKFTHSVLGSFFDHDEESGGDTGSEGAGPVLGGAPSYKFTHSVLGSYINNLPSSAPPTIVSAAVIEPPVPAVAPTSLMAVPEPASWAMMIGGFALTGAALRNRRTAIRLA